MPDMSDLMPNTPDLNRERLEQLKRLMPDLFTADDRLDLDELKRMVDPQLLTDSEKFEFRWFGKADAKRRAFTPTTAALQYDAARSVNPNVADGNMIIEGENLEVLKCLLSAYREKIKCIYIDPPYNTGNDFVYSDNYTEQRKAYWEQTGVTEEGVKVDTNSESAGRYHSNWLNMMYPRLLAARQLLREDGVIIISIDYHEDHHLRKICNEVFGEECYLGTIVWKNATDNNPTNIAIEHEYLQVFCKDKSKIDSAWKTKISDVKKHLVETGDKLIREHKSENELRRSYEIWYRENKQSLWPLDRYKYIDFGGIYTGSQSVHNPGKEGYRYDVIHEVTGKPCKQPLMGYRFPKETMDKLLSEKKILFGEDESKIIELKVYAKDYEEKLSSFIALDGRLGSYDLKSIFAESARLFTNPKPVSLLSSFLSFLLKESETILDFYAGSGTTGHAAMHLNKEDGSNRKFILVQLPELTDEKSEAFKAGYKKISDITIERNKRVIDRITQEQAEKQQQGLFEQGQEPYQPGFKTYRLVKSHFPRVEFQPDPEQTAEENIALLKQYIIDKEATLYSLFNEADIFDEVMLKNGFQLNFTREPQAEFTANSVYRVTDGHKTALVCLDPELNDSTVTVLNGRDEIFICLERAVDTTKKWNLKHQLGEKLVAF